MHRPVTTASQTPLVRFDRAVDIATIRRHPQQGDLAPFHRPAVCQIGVFLAYATPAGRALIDRELYLPRAWTDDGDRARSAGIGGDVGFATKPELARSMLTRALDAGVPAGWLTADEVYGQDKRLRVWCGQHGLPYVLGTRTNDTVATVDWRQRRVRA